MINPSTLLDRLKTKDSAPPGPVLVLGATSAIARAACTELASRGHDLFLAGRNTDALERNATDLRHRFSIEVRCGGFDAVDSDNHADLVDAVGRELGGLQGVLLAFGELGDQEIAKSDFDAAASIIATNFTGAVSILTHCAAALESAGGGFIIALSSVAGDRGRGSNYVYGASKAGLDAFLQGLRNRLHDSGVRVITVKPGFVDTPMTFGRPNMILVASPESVGRRVVRALDGRRDIVYVPWFWQPIMAAIRMIPESIFKRLSL